MRNRNDLNPCAILDEYRGRMFEGRWPSLPQLFDINVERFADSGCFEAFIPEHITLTYSQAKEHIVRVAGHLVQEGVRPGDRVGLTGKNSPEWAVSYLAIMYAGAAVVPVDYSLSDKEIEHLLDYAEINGLFIDGERYERIGRDGRYGFKFSLEEKGSPIGRYVFSLNDTTSALPRRPVSSDTAALLFTSGTTGVPKAVVLSHENLVSDCFFARVYMPVKKEDVFYAILPIHHAYTMLAVFIESISCGCKLVFGKKLTTNQIFKEMKQAHVTMFLAVPMLYNKIIASIMKGIEAKGRLVSAYVHCMMHLNGWLKKHFNINIGKKLFAKSILSKVSLDNNRICISGGGPLPAETFRLFNELGIDFVQGYGLTETSPILTLNPVDDYEENSIGKALPEVQIKFAGSDGSVPGEILVKGPMVMQGYYKNEEATSEVIDSEGWLHTGDIGYMDKNGFVYLTGRAKNIIVTEGGKNVFPEEIEDHFQLFDDVEQVCILGYVDDKDKSSEYVCALIHPSSAYLRNVSDKEEIRAHFDEIVATVNDTLLPYKRIRKTIIVEEQMEMTSTKKIKRFIVAQKYKDLINDK